MKKKLFSILLSIVMALSICLLPGCAVIDKILDNVQSLKPNQDDSSSNSNPDEESSSNEEISSSTEKENSSIPTCITHTFNENTLCTTCGYQEFIESDEYIEKVTDQYRDAYLWWNYDKSYGLLIEDSRILSTGGKVEPSWRIGGYKGTPIDIVIPSEFKNNPIRYVGGATKSPFNLCSTLKSVKILEGINFLEDAFTNCTMLEKVYLPTSLKYCKGAFLGCTLLHLINIPEGIKTIGSNIFKDCPSLKRIALPSSIECIESGAFENCTSLMDISIPNTSNLKEIQSNAFSNTAFVQNQNENLLYWKDWCIGYKQAPKSISFKDGTKGIAQYAFKNCENLTSVTFSDSVTHINEGSFYNCTSLETIEVAKSVSLENIGLRAFYNTAFFNNYKEDIIYLNDWCVGYKNEPKQVYIKEGALGISAHAFSSCKSLEKIIFPDSIEIIGKNAFYKCTSLSSVTLPSNLKEISALTFLHCDALSSINLPSGIVRIGERALGGVGITELFLPSSIECIDFAAVFSCLNLKNIYYFGSQEDWEKIKLYGYEELEYQAILYYAETDLLTGLEDKTIYYYSETEPLTEGNYWHYVDGKPIIW